MTCRPPHRSLCRLGLLLLTGLVVAGCVAHEPPTLQDIGRARAAIDQGMKCAPPIPYEKMTELEKRYLQARGVYFACNDEEASRLAQSIINDAACPRVAAAPPTNRPPTARLTVAPDCQADVVLTLSGEGSRDPDNDRLTYKWDFGDGTTAT